MINHAKNLCKFCELVKAAGTDCAYNTRIFETKNFLVCPSLGSLVPGWVLIIPKKHFLNSSEIPTQYLEEFYSLYNRTIECVTHAFAKPTIFEHGPVMDNSLTGCGVDHAHIHVVPLNFSLSEAIAKHCVAKLTWRNATIFNKSAFIDYSKSSYFLYKEPNNEALLTNINTEISQYFRQIIAKELGIPNHYDYSHHPFFENIAITLDLLKTSRTKIGDEALHSKSMIEAYA